MRRRRLLVLAGSAIAGASAGCSGIPASNVRPAHLGCPTLGDVDRTVCAPETGPRGLSVASSGWVYEALRGDESTERMTVTLHNGSDSAFRKSEGEASVWRRDEGGWRQIHPDPSLEVDYFGTVEVPPGEKRRWTLCTYDALPWDEECDGLSVALSGGNVYAFRTDGHLVNRDRTSVELVAPFEYRVRE